MGLDIYLVDGNPDTNHADIPSDKYPEHINQKNYLRSSYNPSGFNSVANLLVGRDMYYIFEPPEGGGYFYPSKQELQDSRKRAETVLQEIKAVAKGTPLRVMSVSGNMFSEPPTVTAREALEFTNIELHRLEQAEREGNDFSHVFSWYSNATGEFYLKEPPEVIAAIPGVDGLNRQCVHIVTKRDKDEMDHYVQSAEIIVEFIDYALSMEKPVIYWSG